ncbi:MAG: formate dehydrogenase, partial [Sideroxyarcus sp.]
MSVTLYVPGDAAALALGADEVAAAIAAAVEKQGIKVSIVRNGSRGLFWLEPLVEVVTAQGRVAYGPVTVADVPKLFAANFLHGGKHALRLGDIAAHPYLAKQQRVSLRRVGIINPRSLEDYLWQGGGKGLARARQLSSAAIVQEVTDSGLRGRGGAAFPTGIKWKTVLDTNGHARFPHLNPLPEGEEAIESLREFHVNPAQKYIVCNADEGDSGTFSDRMLMEGDPYCLIEGMAIAGHAVGATRGYIYVRSEYPHAIAALNAALENAGDWLGDFSIEVRQAAGAYVCGEETALLESIEGKRGIVRSKPPLPAISGLFGQPTVINNVITFASVPDILAQGAAFYNGLGVGRSRGTLPFQLAGNIKFGGLVEVPFGCTLRELLYDYGGGSRSGRPLRAV